MKRMLLIFLILWCVVLLAGLAQADILTVTFDDYEKFAGTPELPTFSATVEDIGPSTVKITMNNLTGTDAEKIMSWWFNINPFPPALDASDFIHSSGDEATDINVGLDIDKADGDGKFDLVFIYPQSGNTFEPGEQSIYTITDVTAAHFIALSTDEGGHGPYYSAVEQSAWWGQANYPTVIPEPASMLLLGAGLIGLAGYGRKKFLKK